MASTIFIFFQSLRLHILIKNNVENLAATIKIGFIGQFFSNFLPSGIGSDAYKLYFLKNNNISFKTSLTKLLFDKFAGLATLIFFSFIYLLFAYNENFIFLDFSKKIFIYTFVVINFIFLFLYLFKKKIKKIYHSLWIQIKAFNVFTTKSFTQYLLLCVFSFFLRIFRFYIIFYFLPYDFNFFDIIALCFVSQLSMMIPVSVGGLGVVEASLFFTLLLFNVPENYALSLCFYNRLSLVFVSLIGFMIWFKGFAIKR